MTLSRASQLEHSTSHVRLTDRYVSYGPQIHYVTVTTLASASTPLYNNHLTPVLASTTKHPRYLLLLLDSKVADTQHYTILAR